MRYNAPADILLYNVRTPRLRSLSDTTLENGLSIIKENLAKNNHSAIIEDRGSIDDYAQFSPSYLTKPIKHFSSKIINDLSKGKEPSKVYGVITIGLQKILTKIQDERMKSYQKNLAEFVYENNIPVVGKKVWYGHSYKWAEEFNKTMRMVNPSVIIVDGGYHPSVYQDAYIRYSSSDFVVISEGEEAISSIVSIVKKMKGAKKEEIIEAIKKSKIPNLGYKEGDKIVKNPKKHISLSEKLMQKHENIPDGRLRVAIINDALGCPHNACNFCDYRNIYSTYMANEPSKVVDEMKYFISKGVGLFRFTSGSNSLEDCVAIADKIIDEKLKIRYSFFNRCSNDARKRFDTLLRQYKRLIESGLTAVFFGAESGNDIVLKEVINKGTTREDIIYTVRALREASRQTGKHVDISLSMIYPHPLVRGVTLEKVLQDNISLIKETMPDSVLPNPPAPFFGSSWAKNPSFGFDYFNPKDPEKSKLPYSEKQFLIAKEMMDMEYILYLPPKMWKNPNITLNNMNALQLFDENAKFRAELRKIGIETDITDDTFLLIRSAGYKTKEDIARFKSQSMISIISCDYGFIKELLVISKAPVAEAV